MLTVNKSSKTKQHSNTKKFTQTSDSKLQQQFRSSENKSHSLIGQNSKTLINAKFMSNKQKHNQAFKRTRNINRMRIDNNARSSRSRSSSSYCQAGCLRKSAVQSSQGKQNKNNSNKCSNIGKFEAEKLHSAIQKFYLNLSTMPLDMLITHAQPSKWLQQQQQTCDQLKRKLDKLYCNKQNINNTNTNNINKTTIQPLLKNNSTAQQCKTNSQIYQYYTAKLQSVRGILKNIEDNVNMLTEIYQNQLRGYGSNSSLNSSAPQSAKKYIHNQQQEVFMSSPETSSIPTTVRQNNSNHNQSTNNRMMMIKQMPNLNRYKQQFSSYQIQQSSKQSSRSNSQISRQQQKQNIGSSVTNEQAIWTKFNTNLKKIIGTNNSVQQTVTRNNDKYNIEEVKQFDNFAHLLSTCRSQQSPDHSCNRTRKYLSQDTAIQKQHSKVDNNQSKFKNSSFRSTDKNNSITDSISELIAKSTVQGKKKIYQEIKQVQNVLQSMLYAGQEQKLKAKINPDQADSKANKAEKLTETAMNLQTLKPLLNQIHQLKQEIINKNRHIQKLLLNQQQLETVVQMFKSREKQQTQAQAYSLQRIKNMSMLMEKQQKQIQQLINANSQLRQSIHNQASTILLIQKEKQKYQTKLNKQLNKNTEMKDLLTQLKDEYDKQIEQLNKKQSLAVQKMQIYKQKYYQLLHEAQLKKMIMNNTYAGKTSKVKQIWGILADHRKNLQQLQDTQTVRTKFKSAKVNDSHQFDESGQKQSIQSVVRIHENRSPHLQKIQQAISNRCQDNKNKTNKILKYQKDCQDESEQDYQYQH